MVSSVSGAGSASINSPASCWRLLQVMVGLVLVALLGACGGNGDAGVESTDARQSPLRAAGGGNSLNAKACQKNGWMNLVTSTVQPFASESACVSYAAKGGILFTRPTTQSQTISFAPLPPKVFGDPSFSVSAMATSGLIVSFSAGGACSVSGSTVQLTGAGSCTLTASQAGNASFAPAPNVAQTFSIAQGSQTVSFTSARPSALPFNQTFAPTAVATSGLAATISLDATSAGCTLTNGVVSAAGLGVCRINASQAGDSNWAAAPTVQQTMAFGVAIWAPADGCLPADRFGDVTRFKGVNPTVTSLKCVNRDADYWRGQAALVTRPAALNVTVATLLGSTSSAFNSLLVADVLLAPLPTTGTVQAAGELGTLQHLIGLALSIQVGELIVAAGPLSTTAPLQQLWANYKFNGNRYKVPASLVDWGDTDLIQWSRLLMGYTLLP